MDKIEQRFCKSDQVPSGSGIGEHEKSRGELWKSRRKLYKKIVQNKSCWTHIFPGKTFPSNSIMEVNIIKASIFNGAQSWVTYHKKFDSVASTDVEKPQLSVCLLDKKDRPNSSNMRFWRIPQGGLCWW